MRDWFRLNRGREDIEKTLMLWPRLWSQTFKYSLGRSLLYFMHILILLLCFHRFSELLYSKCSIHMERSCPRTSCGTLVAQNAGNLEDLLLSSIAQKRYVDGILLLLSHSSSFWFLLLKWECRKQYWPRRKCTGS
jgi:hypothetical protein